MLSLAKLRVGQEAYQLSGVAESLDAYYTGAGEAPGEWIGGGASRLGLDGEVAAGDLRAVLAGLRPGSGGLSPNGTPIRPTRKRIPGFDATFKVPKSASVLYAVSDDPMIQGAVIDAGEHAVREAIGWLEREAVEVRRGNHNTAQVEARRAKLIAEGKDPVDDGGPRRLKTSGVIGAAFRHRTSRAGDPLLHWHVLIANMAEGSDGRWTAIVHLDLYRHAKAVGEVFQAAFRAELTRTLGVEWRPGRHVPEIAGIPQGLLDVFSKRRAEIEAWLEATGGPTDAAGQQEAVLATRRNKPEREGERLDAGWKAEADDAGWGPVEAEALAAGWRPADPVGIDEVWRLAAVGFDEEGRAADYEQVVSPEEWISELLRKDLTVGSTTFTDTAVTDAVARRLGRGATVTTIERITALVIADPQVLAVATDDGRRWFTSRELYDIEERFVDVVTRRDTTGPIDPGAVAAALTMRPTLGADQATAVSRLAASCEPLSVLIGPAGTGKTYTLDTVRDAYQRAGWRVIGAGPSARAAQELTAGAGIPARTLHALLGDVERGLESLDAHTLLVVDEAGMADIRTLQAVVEIAAGRGSRMLLLGDQHQMPSVGAGGGFAYTAANAGTVAELTVNRRQRAEWEQQALAALRNGSVPHAVGAYLEHGRVVVTADASSMISAAIGRWAGALDAGQRPVMLAGSNDVADRLNRAAIDLLRERGVLDDGVTVYGGTHYHVGERVTLRRNSQGERTVDGGLVDIANGQLGTVASVEGGRLVVRLDRNPDVDVVLDDRYLARGGQISHGYALTTHRAQGGTWDLSITVGVDGLYREAAYTDLSRGIAENWLVITDPELTRLTTEADPDLDRHDAGIDPDAGVEVDDDLTRRLSTSRSKQLAHSVDPSYARVDALARGRAWPELVEQLGIARRAARIATHQHGVSGDQLIQQLATLDRTAHHARPGARVKALDRHNIGTIIDVDDRGATVHVGFVSADGKTAERDLSWQQVVILDATAPRDLPADAVDTLQRTRTSMEKQLQAWTDTVISLGSDVDEVPILQRAVARCVAIGVDQLTASEPDWLHHLIGTRPADPIGARGWHDVATDIVRWRAQHDITGDGLGPGPGDPDAAWRRHTLSARCAATRTWLTKTNRQQPNWPIVRSHRELVQRHQELDAILDTAPSDTRTVIAAARNGQLALSDVDEIIRQAGDTRQDRQHWILEHWPHVVEYAEIDTTLRQQTWGPDPDEAFAGIDHHNVSAPLAAAINSDQPWLRAALVALDPDDHTALDDDQIDWLNDVAEHRASHGITSGDLLGPVPLDVDQRDGYDAPKIRVHEAQTVLDERAVRPSPALARVGWPVEARRQLAHLQARLLDDRRADERCSRWAHTANSGGTRCMEGAIW